MRWIGLLMLATPSLAWAQQVVTSSVISDVAITVYRDPYRDEGAMNAAWPGGYALITETRTITLPKGESQLRFEDVAEGLLPETAIITGLPSAVREKNRDARLISPAGLVDAWLKRRVWLRRTDPATGKLREQIGVIQSGPDGGVVIQTEGGVEALRCSGLPERMVYSGVPGTLSARPTLSILTKSDRAVTATIQLTYMAQGFDWSASYVGNLAPEGKQMSLFAWLTVANGGQQSFPDARLQVVAGKPNKRPNTPPPAPPSAWLNLQCWPSDITSTHSSEVYERLPLPAGPNLAAFNDIGRNAPGSFETKKQRRAREKREREMAEMSGGGGFGDEDMASIVVTGTRVSARSRMARVPMPMSVSVMAMAAPPPPPPPAAPSLAVADVVVAQGTQAQVEALGDLKLYRVPMRVTFAAQNQKQVAMIVQPKVEMQTLYLARANRPTYGPQPMMGVLRSRNVADTGLGVPLPAGGVALFEPAAGRALLIGEARLADKAVGDLVELQVGESSDVRWQATLLRATDERQDWRLILTNARSAPAKAEIAIPYVLARQPDGVADKDGVPTWAVTIEGNGTAVLDYTFKLRP
jgi:hypothetical protein